jgi:sarcosine oxidase subunit beta
VARIVVAGAGAIGASIAYHLAARGTGDRIVLCDRSEVASGATGKAMGGVRQQFTTAPEVRLAQASARFFAGLGPELFEQVGYLFLASTEAGEAELAERARLQRDLGVPVEEVDPGFVDGLAVDDVKAAVICREDGVADPTAVTRHLVFRSRSGGVELREHTDARELDTDVVVIACGAASPALAAHFGVELPIRPLVRQLTDTRRVDGLPEDLPMVIEAETGFHFRRVDGGLRLAMAEPTLRWGDDARVDESLVADWVERLARRYPAAAGVPVARSWAGLYDMTPDAHPIIGWVGDGVYAACGFSGHGFMQAPAVGQAVAEELLDGESTFDLAPYRLERFAGEAVFPETLVL